MRTPLDRDGANPGAGGVAEAMNRVLAAEREALSAVAEAHAQSGRTLEQARREAHRLLDRAERLARQIHGRTAALAARHEALLVAAAEAAPACPDPGEVLDEALARLAARLTGGGDA